MSRSSALAAVAYAAEASFAENVSTFGTRLRAIGAIEASGLDHKKLPIQTVEQLLQGGQMGVAGPKGGSFKLKFWLPGHGSSTAGATAATDLPTLLGYVLGDSTHSSSASAASGTTFTGGTAAVPTTTASGTFAAGSMGRAGAIGDGRGNGQFFAVNTHPSNTMNLLTALDGAPNNADVCYSAEMVNLVELPSSSQVTGLRFLLQTANLEYEAHGCFATSIVLGLPIDGSIPFVEVTFQCAWWTYSTATFPSALSAQAFSPAFGGGAGSSFFLQTQGTVTRAKRTIRQFSMSIPLSVTPLIGPGGVDTNQVIVGATRQPSKPTFEWVEDAPLATATPGLETDWTTTFHMLLTLSGVAGTAMGVYCPKVYLLDKPIQMNDGGINRIRYKAMACADDTKATDLAASAVRFAFA